MKLILISISRQFDFNELGIGKNFIQASGSTGMISDKKFF